MKLLVTGAAGFIGSTYARLVAAEHEVTVLDKLTYAGRRENLEGVDVELVVGAIEDPEVVRSVMEGADAWSTSPPSRTWTARSPTRTCSRAPT